MQKIRQVLLFLDRGFSQRSIERETGINRRTIAAYTKRFIESGFNFNELLLFSNDELYSYLRAAHRFTIKGESLRKKKVTLSC